MATEVTADVPGLTTNDVVAALLAIAKSLDRSQKRVSRADSAPPPADGAVHPGHRYTQAVQWADVLEPHGWVRLRTVGGVTQWRRPGKDVGLSATTGYAKGEKNGDLLYVFSTNAHPFEDGVTYSKFAAYALLNHGGDWRKAARQLAEEGYGQPDDPTAVFGDAPRPSDGATQGSPGSGSDAEFWTHDNLMDAKFSAVRYIVHELIADESVTILGGVQKAGKSWLAIQVAQCVASGQDLFGRAVESGDVIYLALEDGARRLQDRLGKQKAARGLPIIWYTKFPKLDGKDGWPLLVELAARRPRLLVIDTLTAAKSGKTDESDSGPMGDLFNALRELAQKYQIGILVVHHHGKTVTGDPAHDLRGSSAIGAAADVLLGLYRVRKKVNGETQESREDHDPENEGTPDFYLKARGRDIEDTTIRLRFGAKADWLWRQLAPEECHEKKAKAVMLDNEIVQALRDHGPQSPQSLIRITGKSKTAMYDHLRELVRSGMVNYRPETVDGKSLNVYFVIEKDESAI